MLTSRHLSYRYPHGPELHFPDVELDAGAQLLVLGPSGSGKSTLLSLWAGLLTPSSGELAVGATRIDRLSGAQRDRWRGRHVGMVYQQPRLLASQSVRSNVLLGARLAGRTPPTTEVDTAMVGLGIAHVADKAPAACSLGEQQRAGILRALVHRPSIVLADEPTSALDAANATRVADLLTAASRERDVTLVVVTHDERLRPYFPHTLELT